MTDYSDMKETLIARRAELNDRLHEIDDELEKHHSKDWDDLAIEREGDEVLESMGKSGLSEIVMIDAALSRIEAGEYGQCTQCGADITAERLAVLPYTPFCKDCAAANAAAKRA